LQHQKFKNFLKIIIALFADGCMMDMCYIDRAAHEFDNFLSVILSRKMLAKKDKMTENFCSKIYNFFESHNKKDMIFKKNNKKIV
jgi:hypothetical protein